MTWTIDDWWEMLVIGCVLIALFLIVIVFFRGSIPTPWGEVWIGKRRKRAIPPHATCPHSSDIIMAIKRAIALAEFQSQSKHDLVETQIRYWEMKQVDVENLLWKFMANELDGRGERSPAEHPDFHSFRSAMKVILGEMKSAFRVSMRINGLTGMAPGKWISWKQAKVAAAFAMVTDRLNLYYRGTLVRRADLYKATKDPAITGVIGSALNETFEHALAEAERREAAVKEREEEFEAWLAKKITG